MKNICNYVSAKELAIRETDSMSPSMDMWITSTEFCRVLDIFGEPTWTPRSFALDFTWIVWTFAHMWFATFVFAHREGSSRAITDSVTQCMIWGHRRLSRDKTQIGSKVRWKSGPDSMDLELELGLRYKYIWMDVPSIGHCLIVSIAWVLCTDDIALNVCFR